MNILITNTALTVGGGTQTVVVELCRLLRERGHQVMVFSSQLGHVAELLTAKKYPVVSNLRDLPFPPDIIHGQHHLETMSALLALPETPAVYYIHGIVPWQERVPVHPRILAYINLSETVTFRVGVEKSIPPSRFHTLENQLNLALFPSPKPAPPRLLTAAFCPRNRPTPGIVEKLKGLCEQHGIEFVYESEWHTGNLADPLAVYARYDLIFGNGRTALEALASGCAVSITNFENFGPLITPANIADRRDTNLSLAIWENGTPLEELSKQLAGYKPADQQSVTEYIREHADFEKAAERLIGLYENVIEEWKTGPRPNSTEDTAAFSDYLRSLAPLLQDHEAVVKFREENVRLRNELEKTRRQLAEETPDQKRLTTLEKQNEKLCEAWETHSAKKPWSRVFSPTLARKLGKILSEKDTDATKKSDRI